MQFIRAVVGRLGNKYIELSANKIWSGDITRKADSLTDKAFLGHLKTEYVSAIGAAQLPLNATMDGLVALSVAITIIVSHLYGAKKQEKAINYVKSAMLYSGLLGVCVCLLWEFFIYPILDFFKVNHLIINHSVGYVKICALFFLVIGIDSSLIAMLQGLGKTKIIMRSGIIKVFFVLFLYHQEFT